MPAKTISQLTQATTINGTDDFAIEQSGVTKRIAASVVRGDIANANISSSAAIAHSKLAALNSGQILVGNGSNVPTAVSVTGDVTISNAGVTAIGSAKVLPAMLSQPYTLATAQASTSGTSIDFTGIPSWAKRITVMFDGVSTNGSSLIQVQLGNGSFVTTGYESTACQLTSTPVIGTATSGILATGQGSSGASIDGHMVLTSVTGNQWVASISGKTATTACLAGGGSISLGGTLDRIRITTVNGTDTFDAGTINIAYEG